MNMLDIAIIVFIFLESLNVITMYYFKESKLSNGPGIFNFYIDSKENEDNRLFAQYMINWVAGTKLIIIGLLLVILVFGSNQIKVYTMFMMGLTISSYYFKLHPIIKKLDQHNQITPKGYSKALGWMITAFILLFVITAIIYVIG
ncbi:MAG: hypothetical protein R3Y57_02775 [Erysipelotrichaceae bacterium]